MAATLRQKIDIARRFGPRWIAYRTGYALRKKTGALKRSFPAIPWDAVGIYDLVRAGVPTLPEDYREYRATRGGKFLFAPGWLPDLSDLEKAVTAETRARTLQVADDYCRGRFLYFSDQSFDLGQPVNWLLNPMTGYVFDASRHWCDEPTFSPQQGDVKEVWEASRFACAFWLGRAYALARDEKYPQVFWNLFESWCLQNPPNKGPNWKCGQETAVRCYGWVFALYAFWKSPHTTPLRVMAMAKALALSADRIAGNIDFAISQYNNHSVSEAAGLITVGLLFPEFRRAAFWVRRGLDVFEQEVQRQIYDDGAYAQQSLNYHRVMLQTCLWVQRLAVNNGVTLTTPVKDAIARAARFEFEMLDVSGRVPNYGANDGALVLPLASCDYTDFRPAVQAGIYASQRQRVFDRGPWDEALLWLYGPGALDAPRIDKQPSSQRFDDGGYYTLRAGKSWCTSRAHTFRHRPHHVDSLHVDLWRDGINVLRDSGTYKYYSPDEPGFEKFFKDIAAHSTVQIGATGPLTLVSRFLWSPWPVGSCLRHGRDGFCLEDRSYARPPWNVVRRREVRIVSDSVWAITDELDGQGRQPVTLRWQLGDAPYQLDTVQRTVTLDFPNGRASLRLESQGNLALEVSRGEGSGKLGERIAGWASVYYGRREPMPVLIATGMLDLPARIVTTVEFSGSWA